MKSMHLLGWLLWSDVISPHVHPRACCPTRLSCSPASLGSLLITPACFVPSACLEHCLPCLASHLLPCTRPPPCTHLSLGVPRDCLMAQAQTTLCPDTWATVCPLHISIPNTGGDGTQKSQRSLAAHTPYLGSWGLISQGCKRPIGSNIALLQEFAF